MKNKQYPKLYKSGDKINNLTIIKFDKVINGKNYYICKCLCGTEFLAREFDIKNNIVTSCGHDKMFPKLKNNLVGKQFYRLHVDSYNHSDPKGFTFYKCTCSCGNVIIISGSSLTKGLVKSCGCFHKENIGFKHGMIGTSFYWKWQTMKYRCNNQNAEEYHNYGKRGITYDPRWEKFENFKEDMYESYCKHVEEFGEKETTLDRIDVNGNYCKENCRWATNKEQVMNRRNTVFIEVGNKKYTIEEAVNKFGNETIKQSVVYDRIVNQHIDPIIAVMFPSSYIQSYHKAARPVIEKYYSEHNVPIKVVTRTKQLQCEADLEYLRKHSPFINKKSSEEY